LEHRLLADGSVSLQKAIVGFELVVRPIDWVSEDRA
jgi:hypothetical protein